MSLIGNGGFWLATPGRQIGAAAVGSFYSASIRGAFNGATDDRSRFLGVIFSKKSAMPSGYTPGNGAWVMPMQGGDMASRFEIEGTGVIAALNLAGGKNAVAALSGVGSLSATGQLIVQAIAALSGAGTLTAAMKGKLEAAATLAGSGNLTAAIGAVASVVASLVGTGSLTATARAKGNMVANITPFTELSPQSLAAAVWNALVIEYQDAGTMGLLLGEAGGGSSPSTIADAVWDEVTSGHVASSSFGRLLGADLYTAKVSVVDDNVGALDRHVVTWFKNGSPLSAGITLPTIQVVSVATGADLVPVTAMTEIGAIGRFRYDAAGAERLVSGASYLVLVKATIDGAVRAWEQPVGRDSA